MTHGHFTLPPWAFLIGCWVLCPFLAQAQGWQRFHGGSGNDRAFAVRLLADGGIVAAGSTPDSIAGTSDWYFLRADNIGNLLVERSWGDTISEESALSLLPAANGSWLVCGSQYRSNTSFLGYEVQGAVSGIDSSDTPQPVLTYELFTSFNSGVAWANDYLLVGAKYYPFGIDSYAPRFFYQKIDATGSVIWMNDVALGQYGQAEDALILPDGNAVIAGSFVDNSNYNDLVLVKTGAAGGTRILSRPGSQEVSDLISTNGGQLLLVGTEGLNPNEEILLVALTTNLDSLWTRIIPIPGNQQSHAALALPTGNIAIVGEHIPDGSNSRDGFLALTDSLGNLLWFKTYGGFKGDIFWDLQAAPDGNGFIIAGQTASFSPGGDLQAWLLRTDSLGIVWNNRVVGRVTRDVVENCVEDASEPALPGWLVTASGAPGTLYTLTDSSGAYSMNVDTGAWFVSVLSPAAYWSPCEDSVQVDILQLGDTIALDFSVQAVYDCPLLDVDLSTPYMRRCYENTYYVRYFNYGTAAAPNALISIELDPFLTVTGSNLPYTQSGDTLFFSVGQVEAL
ncbi:MAG: hypothetical protein H7246_02720, partial [Phycisphaerae bacterium]|nr:hypothetical protein [Saprospiraceae bacterium]